MSLITVAERVRGPRALTRTLLIMVGVSLSIIVGLLAMHSLNSHTAPAGHSETSTVQSATGTDPVSHHDQSGLATPHEPMTTDAGCAECGDAHSMAWMACVLALLAAVLLVFRPLGWSRTSVTAHISAPSTTWPANAHTLPPPPSLNVLCISRT